MFEIVITIHLLAQNANIIMVSNTKYDTKAICEATIPQGYEEVRRHILDNLVEKFEVDRRCRAVEQGA